MFRVTWTIKGVVKSRGLMAKDFKTEKAAQKYIEELTLMANTLGAIFNKGPEINKVAEPKKKQAPKPEPKTPKAPVKDKKS